MVVMQVDEITMRARLLARRDTTENWNAVRDFVPLKGEIIVYTDGGTTADENGNVTAVPKIKVGDGMAYLIDLPFTTDDIMQALLAHENNTSIHVTEAEKQFWNNKFNGYYEDGELFFTRM